MNQQQRAVVQQTLERANATLHEALEHIAKLKEENAALRQLLEQPAPVQEPVGEVSGHDWSTGLLYRDLEPGTPLYTTPPAQSADPDYKQLYEQLCEQYDVLVNELKPAQPAVPLTTAQLHAMMDNRKAVDLTYWQGVRDAEAHHGITAAPEKGGA